MAAPKKKKRKDSIFKGIRKPTAPPSRKFGSKQPEEKANPAGRSAKHKKQQRDDADV